MAATGKQSPDIQIQQQQQQQQQQQLCQTETASSMNTSHNGMSSVRILLVKGCQHRSDQAL
jgi:hypothetical protein